MRTAWESFSHTLLVQRGVAQHRTHQKTLELPAFYSMMFVLLESLNMFKLCCYSMLINCKALVRSLDQHLFRKKHRNDHFQRLRDA